MTEPTFRIVKGDLTPEELAALVTVLSATAPQPAPAEPAKNSGWSAYQRGLRRPLHPAPNAWRQSIG